jgi:hypothetical protein
VGAGAGQRLVCRQIHRDAVHLVSRGGVSRGCTCVGWRGDICGAVTRVRAGGWPCLSGRAAGSCGGSCGSDSLLYVYPRWTAKCDDSVSCLRPPPCSHSQPCPTPRSPARPAPSTGPPSPWRQLAMGTCTPVSLPACLTCPPNSRSSPCAAAPVLPGPRVCCRRRKAVQPWRPALPGAAVRPAEAEPLCCWPPLPQTHPWRPAL